MAATDMSDLVRLMKFSGHYHNFEGHPRESLLVRLQLLRLVYNVICTPFVLSSVFIGGIKNSIGIELFFAIMGFLTTIQHLFAYIHHKEIEGIIRYLKYFRAKYQKGSDKDFQENTRTIWRVVRMYFYFMTVLAIGYGLLPKFADLIYGIIWDDPIVRRLPMSMDAFLDKNQRRTPKYLIVSVVSVTWVVNSIHAHTGLGAFLCLVGFYYSSMVKTFCSRLYLDTDVRSALSTARVKNIAAQQRDLHVLPLRLRELYGFPYSIQNMFGAFCIVSLLYALLSEDFRGLTMILANIFNFKVATGILSSTAYMGQHITDQSEVIFQAIYNVPWYELRPTDRKYFITMLCAAREPFTIHYHGHAPLNYANFMAILNASYSYFMFMKSIL